ncbi:glycosyltransferase family 2 protein [Candidatus Margulisiibacteriota bacterium]
MKLIIQIPCYNEEKTLPQTLADLPKEIPGIDQIEVVVINDGSTDRTVEIAKNNGIKHIVSFTKNRGLASGFRAGLAKSLELGADVIVNTDADNQYQAGNIADLVKPIINKEADIAIGCRPIMKIKHFSLIKKFFQVLGSNIVKRFTKLDIPDATSGFRAYSREAALKTNVLSKFTYTLETLIQAGNMGLSVKAVPIEVNEQTRKSRLFSNIFQYMIRSMGTILRINIMYRPFEVFFKLGGTSLLIGAILLSRFLYFFFLQPKDTGHIQSLILSGVFLIIGVFVVLLGLIADLIARNRKLNEEVLYQIRKIKLDRK